MKLNPTLDRVVIKKCKFEDINKTKVILVNTAKDNINKLIYEVTEVGPGGIINEQEVIMAVKPGDLVIVPEFIGSEINIDGIQYRIVRLNDILAVVDLE